MEDTQGKRREDRLDSEIAPWSGLTTEKNLFYCSSDLINGLKDKNAFIFFVEIKPKFCLDEVPSYEEISRYVKEHPIGKNIDSKKFYSKYFENCLPSQRKFIYRK